MRILNGRAFVLLLAGFGLACDSDAPDRRQSERSANSVVAPTGRCYRLQFGPWTPDRGDSLLQLPMPEFVYLSDTVLLGAHVPRAAFLYAKDDSAAAWRIAGIWERVGGDTVRLELGDVSMGTAVFLPDTGRIIRGRARDYWDVVGSPMPQADVRAEQITCPAA